MRYLNKIVGFGHHPTVHSPSIFRYLTQPHRTFLHLKVCGSNCFRSAFWEGTPMVLYLPVLGAGVGLFMRGVWLGGALCTIIAGLLRVVAQFASYTYGYEDFVRSAQANEERNSGIIKGLFAKLGMNVEESPDGVQMIDVTELMQKNGMLAPTEDPIDRVIRESQQMFKDKKRDGNLPS